MTEKHTEKIQFLHQARMGLGAWAWGDRPIWNYGRDYAGEDIAEAFKASLKEGVNLVDTAEIYGTGRSEQFLGSFIKHATTKVIVATKFFPIPYRLSKGSVVHALQGSLKRLDLEYVDLYQLHWPSPLIKIETHVEGLAQAVKAGLTRTVGVSNYNKNQMQRAYTILSRYNIPLASNQVEYHLLDRTIEKNGLLDLCLEMGIRLIAYSPLAMGMLTGKYTKDTPPPGIRGRKYQSILKELPALIALMTEIGMGHEKKTVGQVALNWIICKGGLPIPGAKTAQQASQNAGALGWRLKKEEIKALDQESEKLTGISS